MNKIKALFSSLFSNKKVDDRFEMRATTEPNFFISNKKSLILEIKEIWKDAQEQITILTVTDIHTGDKYQIEEALFIKLFKRIPKKDILTNLGMKL